MYTKTVKQVHVGSPQNGGFFVLYISLFLSLFLVEGGGGGGRGEGDWMHNLRFI